MERKRKTVNIVAKAATASLVLFNEVQTGMKQLHFNGFYSFSPILNYQITQFSKVNKTKRVCNCFMPSIYVVL